MITRTIVQHPKATEVHNLEVQKIIRYYHADMYTAIGAAMVVDSDDDNVFVYVNDPRDSMKSDDVSYYGFEKYVDVYDAFECTSSEIDSYMHDRYIGVELQIPYKYGMKQMERVRQIICDAYLKTESTSSYKLW